MNALDGSPWRARGSPHAACQQRRERTRSPWPPITSALAAASQSPAGERHAVPSHEPLPAPTRRAHADTHVHVGSSCCLPHSPSLQHLQCSHRLGKCKMTVSQMDAAPHPHCSTCNDQPHAHHVSTPPCSTCTGKPHTTRHASHAPLQHLQWQAPYHTPCHPQSHTPLQQQPLSHTMPPTPHIGILLLPACVAPTTHPQPTDNIPSTPTTHRASTCPLGQWLGDRAEKGQDSWYMSMTSRGLLCGISGAGARCP
jgi:hypothetical protein